MSTHKKYALVTGGSRGIGRAICIQLAKDSAYTILINYKTNKQAARATLLAISNSGGNAELMQFDVGNQQEVQETLEQWHLNNPHALIEVLVNNAGITQDGLFMWMKSQAWSDVINTNLNGFYNVSNPLIQNLLRNRYGRIINIVSLAGVKGNPGQVNYAAAKAGIIGATKALAQEIAKRNVTVNAVAPGFIESDMTQELDQKEIQKMIPAQRFGKAEEVAHLVSFLASKNSGYITGEVIHINGGLYS